VGENAGVKTTIDGLPLMQKQKITFGIFVFLLLIRLINGFIPTSSWGNNVSALAYIYVLVTFSLLTIVIWLNKENLSSLNIDKYFVIFFILAGVMLFLYFGLSLLGIISALSALLIFKLLRKQQLIFDFHQKFGVIVSISALGLLPIFLLGLLALLAHIPSLYMQGFLKLSTGAILRLVTLSIWGVVYEEMVFRGMLWMILRKLKLNDNMVIVVQALLFWIAHARLTSGSSFWINLPIFSLWVGFLVLKSKSLMPSTITHLVYNLTVTIIKANL
jgi:membrane protease YdiL (CAAX protease family)